MFSLFMVFSCVFFGGIAAALACTFKALPLLCSSLRADASAVRLRARSRQKAVFSGV